MLFLLQEDEPDFGQAWMLEQERTHGESPAGLPRCPVADVQPGRDARAQIERLFAIAGRERSHVIVFDDLLADPLGVYRRPQVPRCGL